MRIQNYAIRNIAPEIDLNKAYSCVSTKDPKAIREFLREVAQKQRVFNTIIHSFQTLKYFALGYIKDSKAGKDDLGSDFFRTVCLDDAAFSPGPASLYRSSPIYQIFYGGTYLSMPILLRESEPLDQFKQKGNTIEEALALHNAQEESRFMFVELFKIIKESEETVSIDGVDILPITEHHADIMALPDVLQ